MSNVPMHVPWWADRIAELEKALAEAESFRLNFEHATKIEREEHQRELAEAQQARERLDADFKATLLDRNELLAHYQRVTSERDTLLGLLQDTLQALPAIPEYPKYVELRERIKTVLSKERITAALPKEVEG